MPATACWRRFASSPKSNCRSLVPPMRAGPSRPLLRRSGRRPLGPLGRAPPEGRARLGGCGVRQSAGRVPLGRQPRDLTTATAIAAHATMLGLDLLRYEPIGWAEEILDAAVAADVRQLPRLYTAASICSQTGNPESAVEYSQTAVALAADPRYEPFEPGVTLDWAAAAFLYSGRIDDALESSAASSASPASPTSPGWVECCWCYQSSAGSRRPGPSPRRH